MSVHGTTVLGTVLSATEIGISYAHATTFPP